MMGRFMIVLWVLLQMTCQVWSQNDQDIQAEKENHQVTISARISSDEDEKTNVKMGRSIHIQPGEVYDDDLVVMGGSALVEGNIDGSLVVFGGSVDLSGKIIGDTVVFGGSVRLNDGAIIDGSLVTFGGSVDRADSAIIEGDVVNFTDTMGVNTIIQTLFKSNETALLKPSYSQIYSSFTKVAFLWWLLAGLLMLLFLRQNIEQTAETLRKDTLKSMLTGSLFLVIACSVILGLTITLIGIPIAILGILFSFSVYIFGVPSGFVAIGRSLTELMGKRPVSILIPGLLGLTIMFLIRLLPWGFGMMLWIIWMTAALGSVIVSKFGTMRPWFRTYPPVQHSAAGYPPPVPPLQPAPPENPPKPPEPPVSPAV